MAPKSQDSDVTTDSDDTHALVCLAAQLSLEVSLCLILNRYSRLKIIGVLMCNNIICKSCIDTSKKARALQNLEIIVFDISKEFGKLICDTDTDVYY